METTLVMTDRTHLRYGLNRTMQYGNKLGEKISVEYKKSLNRTMQYGNSCLSFIGVPPPIVFKSYYVVWKPLP